MIFPVSHQIKYACRLPKESIFPESLQANLLILSALQKKNQGRILSDLAIDVGAVSAQDLKENFQIRMAAPVVPDVTCTYDETHDLFIGKAFDCRIGCAALIETLNQLSTEMLDVDVEATLTVQEEVGERGSMAAVDNIDADVCIVFEGCPADDTFSPDYLIQAALRKGPMLRHFDCSMITNPRFQRFALDLGEETRYSSAGICPQWRRYKWKIHPCFPPRCPNHRDWHSCPLYPQSSWNLHTRRLRKCGKTRRGNC